MIITKTPYRISFFGGGSDYPSWYNENEGKVISTTIDKHLYISCRYLPNFFNHKYRIAWSKIEETKKISQIKHNAVRAILKYLNCKNGLEIHYDGDLPARSGMGSSSCFVVGLLKAIYELENKKVNKNFLAKKSIFLEQKIMKEVVGSQDQVAATFGGFNKIIFKKNIFRVKKIKNRNLKKLNDNLLLIYTGIRRTAQFVANTYVHRLKKDRKNDLEKIISFVNDAEKILQSNQLDDFGELLNESWYYKRKLSNRITNNKINELYDLSLKNGATGGKLLGAGGGGFMLLYVKKNDQRKFLKKMKNIIEIPFKFSNSGTETILKR